MKNNLINDNSELKNLVKTLEIKNNQLKSIVEQKTNEK